MIYRTEEGDIIYGETHTDLVRSLSANPVYGTPKDQKAYLWRAASRIRTYAGVTVDPRTPEAFIEGLERAGLIERMDEEKIEKMCAGLLTDDDM